MNKFVVNTIVLILLAAVATAQSVSVRATANRDKILIGEPIIVQLEATLPVGTIAEWFPLDTIPHFEFIEKGKIDSSHAGVYKQTITITSFDSGYQVVPPLALGINGKYYLTDSIPVMVSFLEFDPKKDYHDIKDIIEVKGPEADYLKWILIGLGVLLLLWLLIWYIRKRRRNKPASADESFSRLSPLEEAIKSLDALKKQQLPAKQFHTKTNDILRWFIYRKHGFTTMQKTNEELILQLEKLKLPQNDFIELAQVLRMSDAVKFAKFIPEEKENEHSYLVIRKSVEQLNNQKNGDI